MKKLQYTSHQTNWILSRKNPIPLHKIKVYVKVLLFFFGGGAVGVSILISICPYGRVYRYRKYGIHIQSKFQKMKSLIYPVYTL